MAKPTIAELQVRIDLQGMGKLAQLTQALNRVGGAAIRRQLDAQAKALLGIEDAAKKAGKASGGFGNFLKIAARGTIVAQGLYRGFKMVGGAIASSLEPLMEFEHNMARVRAKGQLSPAETKAASDAVKAMTGTTQFGPVEASTAAVGLAAAGKGKTLATDLPTMLRFAQANDVDPEKSTEILLGTSGQFGLKKAGDLERIGDMITKADQMSVLNVSQIYDTLKYVGPLAKDAQIPLEGVLSMIVSLGDAGIVASKGGTGLRNLLSAIAAPPRRAKESQKKLDKIHLTQADLQAGFGDIPAFLKDLESRFEKFKITPGERMAINKTLFGQYGMTATSALMGDSTETVNGQTNIQNYRRELKDVNGLMQSQADMMGGTLKNKLQQVNAEWELMQIRIGELSLSAFNEALDKLLKFMRGGGGENVTQSLGDLATVLAEGLPPAITVAVAAIDTVIFHMRAIDEMLGTKIFKPKVKDTYEQEEAEADKAAMAAVEAQQEKNWSSKDFGEWGDPSDAANKARAAVHKKWRERERAELLASLTPEQREARERNLKLAAGMASQKPAQTSSEMPSETLPDKGELRVSISLDSGIQASIDGIKRGTNNPELSCGFTSQ